MSRINEEEIFMFDIDGTLTAPMQKMDGKFLFFFLSWAQNNKVFLIGGSDKEKIDNQIPSSVQKRCDGIFCCMGNELWIDNKIVYQNEFNPPPQLKELLVNHQMYTSFPVKPKLGGKGSILEFRTGMLNFTTIGRSASTEERNEYCEWDKKHKERQCIAREVEYKFPELEVRLGGQISVDIQPRGHNKSQASKWVRKNIGKNIIFLGDKCHEGGNDNDIYRDVIRNNGLAFEVQGPEDTMLTLEKLDSGQVKRPNVWVNR